MIRQSNESQRTVSIGSTSFGADQTAYPAYPSIRYEFTYDGGGLAKGGLGTIFVNGRKVAEGRIERTQPMLFSADEGADVGEDGEAPVVEDYGLPAPYKFTGKIDKITIDLKEMKAADKAQEDKLRAEAAHKTAMSN